MYNPDEKIDTNDMLVAAQLINQSVIAQIELERMRIANAVSQANGEGLLYGPEAFAELADQLAMCSEQLFEPENDEP